MANIQTFTSNITSSLQNNADTNGSPTSESSQYARTQPKKQAEPCPKCGGSVLLKSWDGRFYTSCEQKSCFFGFDADANGNPTVKCKSCGGRVRTAKNGSKVCADCDKWQEPKAGGGAAPGAASDPNMPPKPPDLSCFECGQKMKTIWIKSKKKWTYRCDPCNAWVDVGAPKKPSSR